MDTFHFDLVSPETLVFSGEVEHVVVPGTEGEFGVLAHHAPLVAMLRPGILKILGPSEQNIMVVGGFASLPMLTKNSFLDAIRKHYGLTARAKGAGEQRVLYGHVFRNAMLLIVAGFPAAFISILFTSSLLIEIVFSLDGLGLLGFESAIQRDYPVMFGTLYIFTLLGLLLQIVGDMMYTIVDPRIDFERRG